MSKSSISKDDVEEAIKTCMWNLGNRKRKLDETSIEEDEKQGTPEKTNFNNTMTSHIKKRNVTK